MGKNIQNRRPGAAKLLESVYQPGCLALCGGPAAMLAGLDTYAANLYSVERGKGGLGHSIRVVDSTTEPGSYRLQTVPVPLWMRGK